MQISNTNESELKRYLGILFLFVSCSEKELQSQPYDFIVDQQGNGDFATVQAAIDAVPYFRKNETRIYIKIGSYKEKLTLPETKTNVSFIGEDIQKTILTYDDYASKKNQFDEEIGTSGSSSFFIFGDGFKAENITFENSSGPVGQAVAIRVDGDQIIFKNCRFLGFQDTIYPHGEKSRQYYKNCYIEGTTDFIFGSSTAVFEDCEIFSKEGGHYIIAASTPAGSSFGIVFVNCRLTGSAQANTVYLGRPWRPFAKTVFIKCDLGPHIKTEGWHNWSKPEAEQTAFYAEYQSSGPGAKDGSRASWSYQLTAKDIERYTLSNILNGWIPNENSTLNVLRK